MRAEGLVGAFSVAWVGGLQTCSHPKGLSAFGAAIVELMVDVELFGSLNGICRRLDLCG